LLCLKRRLLLLPFLFALLLFLFPLLLLLFKLLLLFTPLSGAPDKLATSASEHRG